MDDSHNRLFLARLQDAARLCELRNQPKFIGFLDETSAAIARQMAQKSGLQFCFYGGYADAERTILGFFPDCISPTDAAFPLQAIRFSYRTIDKPSHRDVLGALMHCGIERDTVGDILIDDSYSVVFVYNTVARHILEQIKTIGSAGVSVTLYNDSVLPAGGECLDCADTVSSERLDCIVAAIGRCSRADACLWIEQGRVAVNGIPQEKITKRITDGDKLTIRGKGKYIIQSLGQMTKKGRIVLKYKKYI